MFPNEILDKMFAHLSNKTDWLALCKTFRSFKSSAQRLLFRDVRLRAQHVVDATGACALFAEAIKAAPQLVDYVESVQLDCAPDLPTRWGGSNFDSEHILFIFTKLTKLPLLTINIMEQPIDCLPPIAYDEQQELAGDLADIVKNTQAKSVVISTSYSQLPIINRLLVVPVPLSLTVRADASPADTSRDYSGYSNDVWLDWTAQLDLSKVQGVHLEDETRLMNVLSLLCYAKPTSLKRLRMTLPHGEVSYTVAQLQSLSHSLQELHLSLDPYHDQTLHEWVAADFSTFQQLEVLPAPSTAFFQGIENASFADRSRLVGLAWEVEDRRSIVHLLPPRLQQLELRFPYPNGVFARGIMHMRQFRALAEELQVYGFSWILELLQKKRLRRVQLVECLHEQALDRGTSLFSYLQKDEDVGITTYSVPRVIKETFNAAGVELDIQLLKLPEAGPRTRMDGRNDNEGKR